MANKEYLKDDLTRIEYAGHIWEFGHFGEEKNKFSAYGFRQDGTIIRVTSQYEADLFRQLMLDAQKPSLTK